MFGEKYLSSACGGREIASITKHFVKFNRTTVFTY